MRLLIRGLDNAAVRGALRAAASASAALNNYGFIGIVSKEPPFGSAGGVCVCDRKFVTGSGSAAGVTVTSAATRW